jgi:hypothetical protein
MMTNPRKPKTATTPRLFSVPRLASRISVQFVIALLSFIAVQVFPRSTAARDQKHDKPYALIFGTVWGPDNHPLYGVKVKIRRADQKKAHWELYSDHHGEFAQRVPSGPSDYLVWAELKGYKSTVGKELHQDGEVKVHVESDEREDIGLHLKQ